MFEWFICLVQLCQEWKKVIFLFVPYFRCQQLQESQAGAWFLKTKEKNPPIQQSLLFLDTILHRVWGRKQKFNKKTREKSKVAENLMFCGWISAPI